MRARLGGLGRRHNANTVLGRRLPPPSAAVAVSAAVTAVGGGAR
jgi:hypothetical protein